ncbi:hypothetical protein ABIB82_003587 [Bradyrhizobium sp. i1.8.4]|uniref:hypothetical protein n=1 Tax=unclassified Bradyrhizobium TaxID=2631580 RepID=UPI003D2489F9
MSTIFDMLYHEYCRARLAEMRKQLLIPVIGEILLAPPEDSDPPGPRDCGWPTKTSPTAG